MSLETLLEAAEFLEWNKTGKKSRATRTSKKAEKFKANVITERKRKPPTSRLSAATVVVTQTHASAASSSSEPSGGALALSAAVAAIGEHLVPEDDSEDDREDDEDKMVMRDLRRSIGSRETHNKLEKNRRAHLKDCFEELRHELPATDERRSSNLSTLRSALRLIEQLTTKQRELESEKKRMNKLKNSKLTQINNLTKELKDRGIEYNLEDWIEVHRTSTNSTSTASECGEPVAVPQVQKDVVASSSSVVVVDGTSVAEVQLVIQGDAGPALAASSLNKSQQLASQQSHGVAAASVREGAGQMVQGTQAIPQVVKVAKISRGATLPPEKIVLTPKVMSSPAQVSTAMVESGRVFITSIPSQTANILVPSSYQPAIADGIPLTVNPPPRIVRPLQHHIPANLNIAPKQLLLITAGNDGVNQHQTFSPSTITLPVMEQMGRQTLPTNNATHVIPLSSLTTSQSTIHNVHSIHTPAPTPTVIHGVLPSKKSDGTVSYLPIKFTKPAPMPVPPIVASLPVATSYNPTFFTGRGVTIVIPPAATSVATATHNVQLVTNATSSNHH